MADQKNDIDNAYALGTPDTHRAFYDGWAESYDADLIGKRGYQIPEAVADAFAKAARPSDTPVLDIGAGTGLVAETLVQLGDWKVDALDISTGMLEIARAKGLYRECIAADLSGRTHIAGASYGAAISSGTFTHGHLGPDALDEVLRILRPGGLIAITINESHFEKLGFRRRFEALAGEIEAPELTRINVYTNRVEDGHDDDTVLLTVFRKRG